jgi:hypothetical protein
MQLAPKRPGGTETTGAPSGGLSDEGGRNLRADQREVEESGGTPPGAAAREAAAPFG